MLPEGASGTARESKRRRLVSALKVGFALLLLLLLAAALVMRRWGVPRPARARPEPSSSAGAEALPGGHAGSVLDATDGDGLTPLMWAARGNRAAEVESLLEGGADPDRVDDRNGWTPLWHAIHKSSNEAIAALLSGGADPNYSPDPALPTLLFAVEAGETAAVRLLLDAGADPRATNGDGENALLLAVEGGFLKDLDRSNRLFGSCNDEMVKLLLERAPDFRLPPGFESRFARKIAWFHGCTETLRLLNVRARD